MTIRHHTPLPSEQHVYEGLPALSEETLHSRREMVFLLFSGLFLGTLAMLNILGVTRFIDLSFRLPGIEWDLPIILAVGVLPYPITFLCTDFISEIYGRRRANQVVVMGLVLNLWVVLILWLGGALPGPAAQDETLFLRLRTLSLSAVGASMVAYLAAQFIDVQLFHFWKQLTKGRHLWLRNNGSTLVSQLVDTVAVIFITHWAGGLPVDSQKALLPQLMIFIFSGYTFKVVAALLDTGPFYLGVHWLSRYLRVATPTGAPHPPATAAVEAGVG